MKDSYGRTFQCPHCGSFRIYPVHLAKPEETETICRSCLFKGEENSFRALPSPLDEVKRFELEEKEDFNLSR